MTASHIIKAFEYEQLMTWFANSLQWLASDFSVHMTASAQFMLIHQGEKCGYCVTLASEKKEIQACMREHHQGQSVTLVSQSAAFDVKIIKWDCD